MPVKLRETGARLGEADAARPSRRRVTIITAGWGSSGYYSRELLERDGPKVFPAGTHMFLDHPGRAEEVDRPERSVRDLAAVLSSTPRMEGKDLVAEADVFAVWQPVIDSLAENIGLSIRAAGETEYGEAEGRQGPLVTALTEGISVDFVTKAGRGGKVGELIESAQQNAAVDADLIEARKAASLSESRNVGHYFESRIHKAFTEAADDHFGHGHLSRPERIAMSGAIGDALDAFSESLTESAPQLYQRDLYDDPPAEGEGTAVTEAAERRQTQEGDVPNDDRLKALEESVSTIKASLTETQTKLAEAETARDEAIVERDRANEALLDTRADKIVREATVKIDGKTEPVSVFEGLKPTAVERAVTAALTGKLPLAESGKLDEDKLAERAAKAAKAERDYLAENGVNGRAGVSGLGHSATTMGDVDDKELAEGFGRLGMTEKAATHAVSGR